MSDLRSRILLAIASGPKSKKILARLALAGEDFALTFKRMRLAGELQLYGQKRGALWGRPSATTATPAPASAPTPPPAEPADELELPAWLAPRRPRRINGHRKG